jgi:hypothetical protein
VPRRDPSPPSPRPGSLEDLASRWFRGEDLASAVNALRLIDVDPRDTVDPHRVHRACLLLSRGHLKDLFHYVGQARKDFRDVLYRAES